MRRRYLLCLVVLYRWFQKHVLWIIKKYYMAGLVQSSSEATESWLSSSLIISRNSFSSWTSARLQMGETQPNLTVTYYFITIYVMYYIFIITPLWLAWSSVSIMSIYIFQMCILLITQLLLVSWKIRNSLTDIITPIRWV